MLKVRPAFWKLSQVQFLTIKMWSVLRCIKWYTAEILIRASQFSVLTILRISLLAYLLHKALEIKDSPHCTIHHEYLIFIVHKNFVRWYSSFGCYAPQIWEIALFSFSYWWTKLKSTKTMISGTSSHRGNTPVVAFDTKHGLKCSSRRPSTTLICQLAHS